VVSNLLDTGRCPVSWYLHSIADADTHRGSYSTVTRSVHAVCEFGPRALPLGGPAHCDAFARTDANAPGRFARRQD
jgi:hypothetical protein